MERVPEKARLRDSIVVVKESRTLSVIEPVSGALNWLMRESAGYKCCLQAAAFRSRRLIPSVPWPTASTGAACSEFSRALRINRLRALPSFAVGIATFRACTPLQATSHACLAPLRLNGPALVVNGSLECRHPIRLSLASFCVPLAPRRDASR